MNITCRITMIETYATGDYVAHGSFAITDPKATRSEVEEAITRYASSRLADITDTSIGAVTSDRPESIAGIAPHYGGTFTVRAHGIKKDAP